MAPDLAHPDDAPPNLTGRALFGFVRILAVTAVLVFLFYEAIEWLHARHAPYWQVMVATAVYATALLGLVAVWSRSKTAQLCMTTTPAARTYRRRMMIASAVYVGAIVLVVGVNGWRPATGPVAYFLALLPAVGVSGMFLAMGLYLREETDEFQRSVQIESSLWATGLVMILCAVWGFLEMFRLAPHVQSWVVVPVWALIHGLANVFTRRRYR